MVQPLSGLVGFDLGTDAATPEQRLGGPADPRHGKRGEEARPYPWEEFPGESHGPYGPENQLLGLDYATYEQPHDILANDPTADLQAVTRAAPWPKGVPQTLLPDDQLARREQSAAIHATNMGGSREALYEPTLSPQNDTWEVLEATDPGALIPPLPGLPKQVKGALAPGGWGHRDREQSLARQNGYGFDSAHMHRRYATGSIPGNYMWMQPGSRAVRKTIAGRPTIPIGPDSPFSGQDPAWQFDPQGAVLQQLPAPYAPAPEPAVGAAYPSPEPYDSVPALEW